VGIRQNGGMELESFLASVRELLAIPSVADRPEDLHRALEFVLDVVGPGFTVERFESRGKPSALVYRGTNRPRFRVIFNAHLDVVPAPPAQFQPRLEGTRLYGRGTHDMKVSALVQAMVFRDLAATVAYPIALQLVTDEEVGGRDGTLYQLEHGVDGEFVVIGEQSCLNIATESRGLITAYVVAEGRSGHSAYQWQGDNAILKLMESLDKLLTAYPVATEEVWRTTVNLARIETTNSAFNQIPADAQAWLDIRFPAEDTDLNGRTSDEITKHLASFCLPGVKVVVTSVDPACRADHQRHEIQLLQQAAQNQGYRADIIRKHGAADSRFFRQRGIATVIFGIGGDGQHGPHEYVDTTTITPYCSALTTFLTDLNTSSPSLERRNQEPPTRPVQRPLGLAPAEEGTTGE
jgi:succinyl-diaminopimelate desuccinylase